MSTILQAARMEYPETIPVRIGILPATWIKYGAELQRLTEQYRSSSEEENLIMSIHESTCAVPSAKVPGLWMNGAVSGTMKSKATKAL